jgi:hypothetical protein
MKIISKAKLSNLSNQELINLISETQDNSEIYNLLQIAYKKNIPEIFEIASTDPDIIQNEQNLKLTLSFMQKQNPTNIKIILSNLLELPPGLIPEQQLSNICTMNPTLSAIALISQNTPVSIINKIVNLYSLTMPNKTGGSLQDIRLTPTENIKPEQQILLELLGLLEEGYVWNNTNSLNILMVRYAFEGNDKFMNEIAKFNVNPEGIQYLTNVSNQLQHNTELKTNIENNQNDSFKLNKIINEYQSNHNINSFALNVLNQNILNNKTSTWIWNFLRSQSPNILETLLNTNINNQNLLVELANISPNIYQDILSYIKSLNLINDPYTYAKIPAVVDLITNALTSNNSTLQNIVFDMPERFLGIIPMNLNDRKILQEHFKSTKPQSNIPKSIEESDEDKELKELQKLME